MLVCGGAWCPVGTEEVRVRVSLDVCVGVCARVCVRVRVRCVCAWGLKKSACMCVCEREGYAKVEVMSEKGMRK